MENARRARRHLQRAQDLLGFGYIDSSHEARYKMKFGGGYGDTKSKRGEGKMGMVGVQFRPRVAVQNQNATIRGEGKMGMVGVQFRPRWRSKTKTLPLGERERWAWLVCNFDPGGHKGRMGRLASKCLVVRVRAEPFKPWLV